MLQLQLSAHIPTDVSYEVRTPSGSFHFFGKNLPQFVVTFDAGESIFAFEDMTFDAVEEAFIAGRLRVEGDITAALAYKRAQNARWWKAGSLSGIRPRRHTPKSPDLDCSALEECERICELFLGADFLFTTHSSGLYVRARPAGEAGSDLPQTPPAAARSFP